MENNTIEKKKRQEVYREEEEKRVSLLGEEILINTRSRTLRAGYLFRTKGLLRLWFAEDVEALCGPRYHHHLDSNDFRWGRTNKEVTLGGRRIQINRPRVRSEDRGELSLPILRTLKG
ncbi:TPA: hypothetical protein DCX15_05045 [bacterium]|nr:hypothetical protein [bacterium]